MSQQPQTVGGQAVIEGVMMRGPNGYAISVRRADGSINTSASAHSPLSRRYPVLRLPILRGAVSLIEMMVIGMKSLEFSANQAALDDPAEKKPSDKSKAPTSDAEPFSPFTGGRDLPAGRGRGAGVRRTLRRDGHRRCHRCVRRAARTGAR